MVQVRYEENTPDASDLILSSSAVGEVRLKVNGVTELDEQRWVWLEELITTRPAWSHLEDQITLLEGVESAPTAPEPNLPPDNTTDPPDAVPQISGMTAPNAIATIKFISSLDALDLMEEEEQAGKNRTTVIEAIGDRRDELLMQEMGATESEPDEQ